MAKARSGLLGTPGEQEMMDLLNLIASCGLSDEELLPIIKELQKDITITFQEAGKSSNSGIFLFNSLC